MITPLFVIVYYVPVTLYNTDTNKKSKACFSIFLSFSLAIIRNDIVFKWEKRFSMQGSYCFNSPPKIW
ncbi:hypothetical protein HMPREF0514_11874 [Lactobacillus paragasseri JV-V03]|uniref:Uncharacterized protein n=1 Tax=Lactobacillus paragasseri JV-V03 TaxID=525326 RepID=A0AA86ZRH7_9LACO|nr:hypothetical protein HMPREF0514_11874 [Lactobacillus paragasseri JV-V03]